MQQYAAIYLLQIYSTCFGCPSHPLSGVHKTVTAASGTGHSNNTTTSLHCYYDLNQRLQLTILCTPDNGCDGHPKRVE